MKTAIRIVLIATALAGSAVNAQTNAGESTPTAVASAMPAVNKLRMKVVMRFPEDVTTVSEATNYLLEPAGYRLVSRHDRDALQILSRPLMPQLNSKVLTAIEEALLLVSGDDTRLVVDHVNKLVAFERM